MLDIRREAVVGGALFAPSGFDFPLLLYTSKGPFSSELIPILSGLYGKSFEK